MFLSQPVVADHGACRDLLRRLPWDKTFRLTEKKQEATHPKPTWKSMVAETGAHGIGLEQAGKLNNMEIISGYWTAKESKTDSWGRVKETSLKCRLDKGPAWGTSKGPWGVPTPNYRSSCDCLWLTGDYANTCQLQQHQLTAEQQLQHHKQPVLRRSVVQLNISHGT